MNVFLNSNEWQWRLARTVVQGVIGVLIANVDLIVDWCVLDPARARPDCGAGNGGTGRRGCAADPLRG